MRTVMPRMVLVGLALGWIGCMEAHEGAIDSGDVNAAPDTFPMADAGSASDTGQDAGEVLDAPSDAPVPSFDSIYASILVPRCGRCHVEGDPEYGYRPRMTDVETAYAALIDVPTESMWVTYCVPDGVTPYRVRPDDLTASMLAFLPDCYVRDAEHDLMTADELAQIRRWIAAGAPRTSF